MEGREELLQRRLSNYMPVPFSKARRYATWSPATLPVWHPKESVEGSRHVLPYGTHRTYMLRHRDF